MYNKAVGAIAGTLMFISVMVAVILGIYFVNINITTIKAQSFDNIDRYAFAQIALDRLNYCYGEDFSNIGADCEINGIRGYSVMQDASGQCLARTFKQEGETTGAKKVYYVSILNEDISRTCLGKVEVYI